MSECSWAWASSSVIFPAFIFASAAANSIARQPEAAKDISGAVNLPLFLLEGVAIIALVVCILAVVG